MTSHTAPERAPHRPKRRLILVVLGSLAVVLLAALVFSNSLLTWAVNATLRWNHIDAQVQNVELDLRRGSLILLHPRWADESWIITSDTLRITDLNWASDSVVIDALDAGQVTVVGLMTSTSSGIEPLSVATSSTEPFPYVKLNRLSWESVALSMDSSLTLHIQPGTVSPLAVGAEALMLGDVDVQGGTATSPMLPDTLRFEASHLQLQRLHDAWTVQSRGLNLPGIRFEGNLTWPEFKGHGSLELDWDDLAPWLRSLQLESLPQEMGMHHSQTRVQWDFDASRWHAHLHGPDWLRATAMGGPLGFGIQATCLQIPPRWAEVVPSSTIQFKAKGDTTQLHFEAYGDSSVHVDGRVEFPSGWADLASGGKPIFHSDVHVARWGNWLTSSQKALHLALRGDSLGMDFGLDGQLEDWAIAANGSWASPHLEINLQTQSPAPLGVGEMPLALQGRLRLTSDEVSTVGPLLTAVGPDTLFLSGNLKHGGRHPFWSVKAEGNGLEFQVNSADSPALWTNAFLHAMHRKDVVWPMASATGFIAPGNPLGHWVLSDLQLLDTSRFYLRTSKQGLHGQWVLPHWSWQGFELNTSHVTVQENGGEWFANLSVETEGQDDPGLPSRVSLDMHADTSWHADLTADFGEMGVAEWSAEGTPPEGSNDPWRWTVYSGSIPLGGEWWELANLPLRWSAPLKSPLPEAWEFKSNAGFLAFEAELDEVALQALRFEGQFSPPASWLEEVHPMLAVEEIRAQGMLDWGNRSTKIPGVVIDIRTGRLDLPGFSLPELESHVEWAGDSCDFSLLAVHREAGCTIDARGAFLPDASFGHHTHLEATNLPLEWLQPWVDTTTAVFEGRMNADLRLVGSRDLFQLAGTGSLDTLSAFVPSLGTSFGGQGAFDVEPYGVVLRDFHISDERGTKTRVDGALMHDHFQDWNLDVAVMDAPENLVIMNLPAQPNAPVYGLLSGRGTVDVFFWNNQVTIQGDVVADAPTSFSISLVSESDDDWSDLVRFVQPTDSIESQVETAAVSELGVLLDLNIEALPGAKVIVVTDEENNSNIVGNTQGSIRLRLEDWERMSLQGELEIVEGQYDFALGPFLKKSFVARPGGKLFWDGDPYRGQMQLDAVYTTRANVEPLLGNVDSGTGMESIDVILHLSGPMLQPNIAFELQAPQANRLVSEALASALADESDRTNQAIALLSLQEFLPQQFNTMELGANGLQEYSIDMVTSQLSRWLSRINDDVEVGIRYDAQNPLTQEFSAPQDALQVALKATFLQDKLEVEGALGSSAITQEALGAARLQNIRVLYHLNPEKGLELTGFSESQSSATQAANSLNQGIGLRWHKSFDWKPRKRQEGTSE